MDPPMTIPLAGPSVRKRGASVSQRGMENLRDLPPLDIQSIQMPPNPYVFPLRVLDRALIVGKTL